MIKLFYLLTFMIIINVLSIHPAEVCPGHNYTVGESFKDNFITNFLNFTISQLNFANVTYTNSLGVKRQVICGSNISVSDTIQTPKISYNANSTSYYAVIMLDLDNPSPLKRTTSPYLHWRVINILGNNVDGGNEEIKYETPSGTGGTHRYTFMVFLQQKIKPNLLEQLRIKFDINDWVDKHGLKVVAGNFYYQGLNSYYNPKG